jgi:hypothetical protein
MKNKILSNWGKLLSSVLSFFGIVVGSFACAYGVPYGEEGLRQLYDLEAEINNLQQKLYNVESEKADIQKDIANRHERIKMLNHEKDSLTILLQEFDK